jgi:peptide deformylase
MPVKKILTITKHEKILKTASEPVKKINKEIKDLIRDIKDTMADPSIPALGLAAVQIGALKRVFGIYIGYYEAEDDDELEPTIFINPEIIEKSEETAFDHEGCLSIPGMQGNVERKFKLKLRWMDEKGKTVEREFEGDNARAVQHEYDHLDGILFLQRLASLDELFVYVSDKKGNIELVPYPEIVGKAAEPVDQGKLRPFGAKPNTAGSV